MILDENACVWIYGGGGRGRKIAERLKQEGIEPKGFIDRDPERCDLESACVRLDEVDVTSNSVAICSIANVFTHAGIAMQLAEHGFRYIIYKAFGTDLPAKHISALYDGMTSVIGHTCVKGAEIPAFEEIAGPDTILSPIENGLVRTNIPVELLFGLTEAFLNASFLSKDERLLKTIPGKSLLYYTSPQKMMQYFAGRADESSWARSRELWFACRNAQTFAAGGAIRRGGTKPEFGRPLCHF